MHDRDSGNRSTLRVVDLIAVATCLTGAIAAAAAVLAGLACL